MKIGPRIRRFRILAGLTQDELAKLAKVSRAAVSLYESGEREPDLATQGRLSSALGITMVDLIGSGQAEELSDQVIAFARQLEALTPEQQQAVMNLIRTTMLSKTHSK